MIRLAAAAAALGVTIYCAGLIAASPDTDTVIKNEAVSSFLFKSGQRLIIRSNLTETVVQNASVAAALDLTLSSPALVGNGLDSCLLTAHVSDVQGDPVPDGQPVSFAATGGTFSNGKDTVFVLTAGGVARTQLRSPVLKGDPFHAAVTGTTLGVGGVWLARQQGVLFYPGGLAGTVLRSDGQPLAGVSVTVLDMQQHTAGLDTTRADGTFLVPLRKTGLYRVLTHWIDEAGDARDLGTSVDVTVPETGGTCAARPLNAITGRLIDGATGTPFQRSGVPVLLTRTDGSSPASGRPTPALAWTDERGVYTFDSLAAGPVLIQSMDLRNAGQVTVQQPGTGLLVLGADLRLSGARGFEIAKTCNQRIVEIGDILAYTVEVKNTAERETLFRPVLSDNLPVSFVYARGTARRDGQPLPDPPDDRRLCWSLADSLPPGRSIRVTYAVLVGSGALESDGINRARAMACTPLGDTVQTAVASAQVTVRPGLFTDRGIVVGKVFYDNDEDGRQEDGEEGIPGVELLMEDGTRVVTGDDGKYSLPEVRPGQHVIRVNQWTLPHGAASLAAKSDFAGDGWSRFLRLTEGGIARSDFSVKRPAQATLEACFSTIAPAKKGEKIAGVYRFTLDERTHPASVTVTDSLPPGFKFDPASLLHDGEPFPARTMQDGIAHISLPDMRGRTADSLLVTIVADSDAVGRPLMTSGRLTLGFARGRNTEYPARQRYDPDLTAARTPPTVQVAAAGEVMLPTAPPAPVSQADTVRSPKTTAPPAVTDTRPPLAEKGKSPPEKPARKKIHRRPATPAGTGVTAPPPVAASRPVTPLPPAVRVRPERSPVPWMIGAGGLAAVAAVLFLWRRFSKRRFKSDV